jgi:hypothetical protein
MSRRTNRQFSREKIAFEVNGTIGEEGVSFRLRAGGIHACPIVWQTHRVTAVLQKAGMP